MDPVVIASLTVLVLLVLIIIGLHVGVDVGVHGRAADILVLRPGNGVAARTIDVIDPRVGIVIPGKLYPIVEIDRGGEPGRYYGISRYGAG